MNSQTSFPAVGSTVEVDTIRLVERHQFKRWLIVAETDVSVSAAGDSPATVVGKIPIDEISPYFDFDPGRPGRSWELRREMARVILAGSDRRFVVIDQDPAGGHLVLSLEQVLVREHTVTRTEHGPPYVAHGFRDLQNLHYHLLKHPLGLGADEGNWPALLGLNYWREGILQRLKNVGCPAARQCAVATRPLSGDSPCTPCSTAQKLRCFEVLGGLRKAYERAALACVTQASNKRQPRHYHYSELENGQARSTLIFMDDQCRKVVAKRGDEPHFMTATLYRPDDCDPEAPTERLKYLAERRKRIAPLIGRAGDVAICVPPTWGY